MHVDYKLIGGRIKERRKARGMTQEQLAEALSVTVGYVSQMERGVTKINLEMLAAIAQQVDSDIAFFVTGVSETHTVYLQDEVVEKYQKLNSANRQVVLEIMEILFQKQNN